MEEDVERKRKREEGNEELEGRHKQKWEKARNSEGMLGTRLRKERGRRKGNLNV